MKSAHPRGGRVRPLLLLLGLVATTAVATVPMNDRLLAERDCPLYQSIKKQTNPDGARVTPGEVYPVIGKNREDASHYRVRADGASPSERWVEVGCGTLLGRSAPQGVVGSEAERTPSRRPAASAGFPADRPAPPGRFVLAASWQPAFCELRARRPECRSLPSSASEMGGLGFSLHGLWPQPRDNSFCGVSAPRRDLAERGPWSRLPALNLSHGTRRWLEGLMPGTQSHLHRYQWTKHGTCYGADPERYFRHSAALIEQLNASAVRGLFLSRLGLEISAREVRAAFDEAFGRGAGARVRVRCDGGMVSELQIGLEGRVSESASLAGLIRAAERRSAGCPGGRVDAPGPGRR